MGGGGCVRVRPRCVGLVVLAAALIAFSGVQADADEHQPWRDLLERAVEAGRDLSYRGQLVVVSFGARGPTVDQFVVSQGTDGSLVTDRTGSWLLGQRGDESFFGDHLTGTLLRLGAVERTGLALHRLARKYEVSLDGAADVAGGTAAVVVLRERGARHVRERLYVDRHTGLLVRRETFRADGQPVRLATLTSFDRTPTGLPPIESSWPREVRPTHAPVSRRSVRILREVGWVVPDGLPGAFDLVDASAVGDGEGSSLHLFYSDGLYTLSVYEQHGTPDGQALLAQGAEPGRLGRLHVFRFPRAQPDAYVWGGGGLTFTAVSDVAPDALAEALEALPHDPPSSVLQRVGRGLRRVGTWLWPFD